jgi:hypothetical protein
MTPANHQGNRQMRKRNTLRMTAAAMLLAAAPLGAAQAADGGAMSWRVTPMYAWLPSIKSSLDLPQPPLPSTSNESSFTDVVSKIDWVATLHAEGQGDDWGFLADVSYLALSDQQAHPLFETEASLDMTVAELAAVWSPGATRYQGFEAFVGTRYFRTKLDAKFTPANPVLPQARVIPISDLYDCMIGARYTARLSDRWNLVLRGDGSFGDTDGTYGLSATLQWRRSDQGYWIFGYKYFDLKLKTGGDSIEVKQYGPGIGYTFTF